VKDLNLTKIQKPKSERSWRILVILPPLQPIPLRPIPLDQLMKRPPKHFHPQPLQPPSLLLLRRTLSILTLPLLFAIILTRISRSLLVLLRRLLIEFIPRFAFTKFIFTALI